MGSNELDIVVFRQKLRDVVDNENPEEIVAFSLELESLLQQFPSSSSLLCLRSDFQLLFKSLLQVDEDGYRTAVQLDPLNAYALECMGHLCDRDSELILAEEWFERSIEASQSVDAYSGLSSVLEQQGKHQEAMEVATFAMDYAKSQVEKAATLLRRLDKTDKANKNKTKQRGQ